MRSGKEWASLMHFMDPEELDGLHVIGRAGRTMLHRYAASSANQMS